MSDEQQDQQDQQQSETPDVQVDTGGGDATVQTGDQPAEGDQGNDAEGGE